MLTGYHFWGLLSSALFLLSVPAIFHQLQVIWKRKKLKASGALSEPTTQSISLNQIFSSYCGVYSFFLFGLVSKTPDPFLTYPRAIVGILLYLVVVEICKDRQSRASQAALAVCSISVLFSVVLVLSGARSSSFVESLANSIVCFATVLLAQGNISQYLVLKESRKRGAVSIPMHLALYLKDFAGMMFGFQLGASAWSIILMHVSNLIMRAPIFYAYLRLSR
jgi:hypothetical protein